MKILKYAHDWLKVELPDGRVVEIPTNCNLHKNPDCYDEEIEKIRLMDEFEFMNIYGERI